MATVEEKLEKAIALLEEGNQLRREALDLAKRSFERSNKLMEAQKDFQEKYNKHALPVLKWAIPVTLVILVLVGLALYVITRLIFPLL